MVIERQMCLNNVAAYAYLNSAALITRDLFNPAVCCGSVVAKPFVAGRFQLLSDLNLSSSAKDTVASRGEKRKAPDISSSAEDAKQPRLVPPTEGDTEITYEVLNEVVATVTDPAQMLGPEVCSVPCIPVFTTGENMYFSFQKNGSGIAVNVQLRYIQE